MISYGTAEVDTHAVRIQMVANVPIGNGMLTQEGYLIYCTESEKYMTYRTFTPPKLDWEGEPTNLFLSDDFDISPMLLVALINDMQIFIGEKMYSSCIVVPTVVHSRQVNAKRNIIEVYLIKKFKQSFSLSDIAPWQR